ncbi:response regulator [bacterium]|nr:response regulator [bacterium]
MFELNSNRKNFKILVIDDDLSVLEVLRMMLEHDGYHVITAPGGLEGIEIYKQDNDISLVIIDLTMPDIPGIETLKRIIKINPSQKVMMASGYDSTESAQEAIDLGACYFMEKPFDIEKLFEVIRNIIGNEQV